MSKMKKLGILQKQRSGMKTHLHWGPSALQLCEANSQYNHLDTNEIKNCKCGKLDVKAQKKRQQEINSVSELTTYA